MIAYLKPYSEARSTILKLSYGNPIMVAESLSNISYGGPNIIQDCCFWARVAFYHLDEKRLVDVVKFQTNEAYWGNPAHPE